FADTTTVNVSNAPDFINIIPASVTLASINDTLSNYPVDFKNALGAALLRTAVKWSSEDPSIAKVTIDNTGSIIAVTAGDTRVFAENSDGSKKDTLIVHVTNAAETALLDHHNDVIAALTQTLQYGVVFKNARGNLIAPGNNGSTINGQPITWTSLTPAVAT